MKNNHTEIIKIRFTKDEKAYLQGMSFSLGMPMNAVVRSLIDFSAGIMEAQKERGVYDE